MERDIIAINLHKIENQPLEKIIVGTFRHNLHEVDKFFFSKKAIKNNMFYHKQSAFSLISGSRDEMLYLILKIGMKHSHLPEEYRVEANFIFAVHASLLEDDLDKNFVPLYTYVHNHYRKMSQMDSRRYGIPQNAHIEVLKHVKKILTEEGKIKNFILQSAKNDIYILFIMQDATLMDLQYSQTHGITFPGGKGEKDEFPDPQTIGKKILENACFKTVRRETFEEIGIDILSFRQIVVDITSYQLNQTKNIAWKRTRVYAFFVFVL